jgi:amino acid adenylation domain-containing protein
MKDPRQTLDTLSPERRALLELMRARAGHAAAPRRLGLRRAPLSFAQQRLWIISQLQPDGALYHVPAAVRIAGELDAAVLERALGEVVRRHEVLRTTFPSVEGEPRQVVAECAPVALPFVDVEGVAAFRREEAARLLASELARRPFDLAGGPVWRAALVRLDAATHLLIFVVHHIAFDGWSRAVLISEITKLYEAFRAGRPSPLPELPVQYSDYAVWQRQALEGSRLQAQLDYWKRRVGGSRPALRLLTDRPKSASRGARGAARSLLLPTALAQSLERLGRSENVTPFMLLLAAFKCLLMRYTGQHDLTVGVPITNRSLVEVEGVIGFFVNALALRSDLSGGPTFREYLRQVRAHTLDAYANQDIPFEKLVEELQPERDADGRALYQVAFSVQDKPMPPIQCAGLTLSPVEVEGGGGAKLDLALAITATPDGLLASLKYDAELFEPETCDRMLRHYRTLLGGIVGDPETRLSLLPMMDESECRLIEEWGGAGVETEPAGCCHELFEAAARRQPHALAVVGNGERLTYGELNERANRLGRYLRARGVTTETPVALCMERGVEMLVGLLGILKAGGVYVPLDPAHLGARASFILQDSQAVVLLTHERLLDALGWDADAAVCLDRDAELLARQPSSGVPHAVTLEDAAYIIYTSGSTGRPKGAIINHRGLANVVSASAEVFGVNAQSRVLQFASVGFDASVWQMFTALQSGATLVVATEEERHSGLGLVSLIERERVDTADLPPSLLSVLPPERMPTLRVISTGGERVTGEVSGRWYAGRRFFNVYGPTETSVAATMQKCRQPYPQGPPIGRPVRNVRVYILDAHGQTLPVGCPGELHIGGAGVGRGYLRRPALTAERFVPDPFSRTPGARLYKSGDWARYSADGRIEFLGRRDRQVQLRGFRIELDEVESVVREHTAVEEAAVIDVAEESGRRLVAYVVLRGGRELPEPALRLHLKARLPEYMVPSLIRRLDEMPRGVGGKIDRERLPRNFDGPEAAQACPPRSPVERELVGIWSELLRADAARIGIYDSFFELGGHSLLAIKLLFRIKSRFGVDLPFSGLFQDPTVAGLGLAVVRARSRELGGAELGELLADIESLSEAEVEELLSGGAAE